MKAPKRLPILGFRSGKRWKKIVSMIYYIPVLFFLFISIVAKDDTGAFNSIKSMAIIGLVVPLVIGLFTGKGSEPNNANGESTTSEDIYLQAGIYTPSYSFSTVDGYKDRLKNVRARQKDMIADKAACTFPVNFKYNGSQTEGARVINDWMNLMLRAFNGESEVIIDHVTYLNYQSSKDRIRKSADSINKYGKRLNIAITDRYVEAKLEELDVAFDYQQFKEAEKERLRQIREEEKEKAKLEKELQERRQKIIKDQKHVATELAALNDRLSSADPGDAATIQARIVELNEYTQKLQGDLANVEDRAQQARAGYVYVISNIGSFGENVYKIGMTRRLEPQDRVDELGDASVPFKFDVHAFIFAEDAVALEGALHEAFSDKRVNLVNLRKEFFRVTLDEIEACVKKNHSGTVEFTRTATAQEYRETLVMKSRSSAA